MFENVSWPIRAIHFNSGRKKWCQIKSHRIF
jgi:hypothetical protein